jgi:hypothetical protein
MDRSELPLLDFASPGCLDGWFSVDDVVMGGHSYSRLSRAPEGYLVFSGEVILEPVGGFASVRSPPVRMPASACGVRLRLRGDGHRYKVNLKTDPRFDGFQYQVPCAPQADRWEVLDLPLRDFRASFRGRPVSDAPPLTAERVHTLGLMVADRQAGPFRLDLEWVRAYFQGRS